MECEYRGKEERDEEREGSERGMRTGREGWGWRKKGTWREEIEKGMRMGK